jgi:hypothetical protein
LDPHYYLYINVISKTTIFYFAKWKGLGSCLFPMYFFFFFHILFVCVFNVTHDSYYDISYVIVRVIGIQNCVTFTYIFKCFLVNMIFNSILNCFIIDLRITVCTYGCTHFVISKSSQFYKILTCHVNNTNMEVSYLIIFIFQDF